MSPPVIVGAGLAGLTVALSLAPKPVIVLGRKLLPGLTSSSLAQGGLAAALGEDDNPQLHAEDTIAAGAGLCDPEIVKGIVGEARRAVETLSAWGASFDRDGSGRLKMGLEGAHSRRRIVHADGDATGAVVMRALLKKALETPSVAIMEDVEVTRLLTDDSGAITGLVFRRADGTQEALQTRQVILATGSACALWRHATVPLGSWGHGLALAARAGARLRDLEFVQFHPTALDAGCDPMPLVSEAVRGEGARLVTAQGPLAVEPLAPRDIVATAIWAEIEKGGRVFLDARKIPAFGKRFPTIAALLAQAGLDASRDLIPIRPVAHYHMGGIATDAYGRTDVKGLWACGECASVGLHGANRLASNSLLEAAVMGLRIAKDVAPQAEEGGGISVVPALRDTEAFVKDSPEEIAEIRENMGRFLGVRRDAAGIETLIAFLEPRAKKSARAFVGLMIAKAALARQESRAAHQRTDFPATELSCAKSSFVRCRGVHVEVGGES